MAKRSTEGRRQWVAVMTFYDERANVLREAGAVYQDRPYNKAFEGARLLVDGEHQVSCPRCGQRFVTVEDGTAEELRDLHLNSDEDMPSVCPAVHAADAGWSPATAR
jgi:hypothetical protein